MNDIFYATGPYSSTYYFCYCGDGSPTVGETASLVP